LNFEQPSLSSAYLDLGYIDAKAIIAQGIAALKQCARLRGVKISNIRDEIFEMQQDHFSNAYRSMKSGCEDVKLALADGDINAAKLNAALRTDNIKRLQQLLNALPPELPADIRAWLQEHEDVLTTLEVKYPNTW